MKGNRANQKDIFYRNQNETHVIFQIIEDRLSSSTNFTAIPNLMREPSSGEERNLATKSGEARE